MTASPPSIGKNSWEMVGSASLSTNSGARVRVENDFFSRRRSILRKEKGMTTTRGTTVVGVFDNDDQAKRAIDALKRAGFRDDQIGFIRRRADGSPGGTDADTGTDTGTRVASGVVGGGVLGGILGAAASLLIPGLGPAIAGGILAATLGGAAIGAAAGGIIGALTDVGVPEEEARYYQGEFEAGRVIVTVRADGREQEARGILRQHGARDATDRAGSYDPNAPGTRRDAVTGAAGTYDRTAPGARRDVPTAPGARRDDPNAPGSYDPTAPGARRSDSVGTPGTSDTDVRTGTARPNVGTRTYDADAPGGSTDPNANPMRDDDTLPPDRPQGR
jgi:hypothetical protein